MLLTHRLRQKVQASATRFRVKLIVKAHATRQANVEKSLRDTNDSMVLKFKRIEKRAKESPDLTWRDSTCNNRMNFRLPLLKIRYMTKDRLMFRIGLEMGFAQLFR